MYFLPGTALSCLHTHRRDRCTHRQHRGPGKDCCHLCSNQADISEEEKHKCEDISTSIFKAILCSRNFGSILKVNSLISLKHNIIEYTFDNILRNMRGGQGNLVIFEELFSKILLINLQTTISY